MTTFILEGGLGNLLFQLNYYFGCREFLKRSGQVKAIKLATINGFMRDIYFNLSPAIPNRDTNILHALTGISPDTTLSSSALVCLGLSKIANSPVLGYFHDKYSRLSIE